MYISYESEKIFFLALQSTRMNFYTKIAVFMHLSHAKAKIVSQLAFSCINIQQNMFMLMHFYFKIPSCIEFSPWIKEKKHIIAVNPIINGANIH